MPRSQGTLRERQYITYDGLVSDDLEPSQTEGGTGAERGATAYGQKEEQRERERGWRRG